jgi:hypothetical protein
MRAIASMIFAERATLAADGAAEDDALPARRRGHRPNGRYSLMLMRADTCPAKKSDDYMRRTMSLFAKLFEGEVSGGLDEGCGGLLRLKLSFLTGTPQRHSKHFPARSISDNDLIAGDISRALVPGKVPRHPDRLLHCLDKGR